MPDRKHHDVVVHDVVDHDIFDYDIFDYDDCAGFGHHDHVAYDDVLVDHLVNVNQFDFIDDFLIDDFDHRSGFGV